MKKLYIREDGPAAIVLGIMQDGGLPHAGCRCARCAAAFEQPDRAEYTACLGLVDPRPPSPAVWLIDATPDIKYQLDLLSPFLGRQPKNAERLRQPDGLFLTHAHMGHTAGLVHLGPEGMNVQGLPVYASAVLVQGLRSTPLWRPLVDCLDLIVIEDRQPVRLAVDLVVTPLAVPHRDELGAGTFGYHIQGPRNSLLYVPDIDNWEAWPESHATLSAVDLALVDATFYSPVELGRRPPVAHPLISDTLAFFADIPAQLVLTHLNHTNPVQDLDGEARRLVAAAGAQVACTGLMLLL